MPRIPELPRGLSPKHRQAIRLLFAGLPSRDVGPLLGVRADTVRAWRCSEPGKAYWQELEDRADTYVCALVALGLTPETIAARSKAGNYPHLC